MKTLLILAAGTFLSLSAFADHKNPSVTIRSKKNFVITVDGKRFQNENLIHLKHLRKGMHTIKVYERSRGIFGSRMRLVSARHFMVRNNDLRIQVDYFGRVNIDEVRKRKDKDRDRRYDDDWDKDRQRDEGRNRSY